VFSVPYARNLAAFSQKKGDGRSAKIGILSAEREWVDARRHIHRGTVTDMKLFRDNRGGLEQRRVQSSDGPYPLIPRRMLCTMVSEGYICHFGSVSGTGVAQHVWR
jgi:hypothetical protein